MICSKARTVYKPVANAVVVVMYANHIKLLGKKICSKARTQDPPILLCCMATESEEQIAKVSAIKNALNTQASFP
jgi:hypothetical protein